MYVVETAPGRQYDGRLVFDDVAVQSAPDVDVPEPEVVPDLSVVTGWPPRQGPGGASR